MDRPPLARLTGTILVITAWALPVAVFPGLLMDAAELPKLCLLAISTALLAGILVAGATILRRNPLPATPLLVPMAGLLFSAGLSCAGTPAPGASLAWLLWLLAMFTAFASAAALPDPDRVFKAMLGAAGLVTVYAIGQFVGFEPLSWSSHFRPRVFATLGNPVFLGGFLALVFPLAFARWLHTENEEEKDLLTLLVAGIGIAVFLTWTRGSWLALFAGAGAVLGMSATHAGGRAVLKRNRVWLLSLAVLGLIAGVLLGSPKVLGDTKSVPLADRLRDAVNPRGFSFSFRMVTWESAMRIAFRNPALGGGTGAFMANYPQVRLRTKAAQAAAGRQFFPSQEMYAHNDHLQVLAEQGVVGLGVWIWLIVCILRLAWSLRASPGWVASGIGGMAVSAGVDATFNFPFHIAPAAWMFFACLGLLKPAPPAAGLAPSRMRIRLAWALAGVFGLVVLPGVWRHIAADRALAEGDKQMNGNNWEMAEYYYARGAQLVPLDRSFRLREAAALVHSGRFEFRGESLDAALIHIRQALALGFNDENVYKQLSIILGKKLRYAGAVQALDEAFSLNPQREDIANNLSFYLSELGIRPDDAIRLARRATELAPGDPTYLDTYGYAFLKAGRFREAVRPLTEALRKLPANSNNPAVKEARDEVLVHLAIARRGSWK